jgi:hypothetical protein
VRLNVTSLISACIAVILLLLVPRSTRAQLSSSNNIAKGKALYDKALMLMEAKNSMKLVPRLKR